jgi:hypothetical protein
MAVPPASATGAASGSAATPRSLWLDVKAPPFACVADGVADDTRGIQAALDAFAAATRAGLSPRLYLPAGIFRVSSMLTLANARGGIIAGEGQLQTILQAAPGTTGNPALLRLVNCQNVTCQDFTMRGLGGKSGPVACWESYGDASLPGFSPTANRCERVSTDTSQIGFATGNAGGLVRYPTNRSDQNNENVKLIACTVLNSTLAAVRFVGRNSLCHDLVSCDLNSLGAGISLPSGGSFRMIGGSLNATTWDLDVAGFFEHQSTIVGTYAESNAGFLRADGSVPREDLATNLVLRVFGFDKKGFPKGPGARLIDFTGTRASISFHGCELSPGAAPGQLTLSLTESNPECGAPSVVSFHDCDVGADEFALDRFTLIDAFSRWTASGHSTPSEDLRNGASVVQWSAGNAFSPTGTQYKLGAMRGVRSIGGAGAKPGLNLCNVATLVGGKGASVGVTFPGGAEVDTNYSIVVTPTTTTGTPAPHSWRLKGVTKGTTGFTLTTEADPGAGNSVSFDWHLMRWG